MVATRKEFIELMRKEFIPHCVKTIGTEGFNMGYALNNWTMFFYYNSGTTYVVELIEEVK